ncbi:MAG: GC-type dockerin domain-anchored protein [Phycisphaerales bacterium]
MTQTATTPRHTRFAVALGFLGVLFVGLFTMGRRNTADKPAPTPPLAQAAPPPTGAAPEPSLARARTFRVDSLRPGEPVPRILDTPLGPRFVSVMLLEDGDPPDFPFDAEPADVPEPSDLDADHPGAYWSNAGFTTLREVVAALALDPAAAWVDSPSGELLLNITSADGTTGMLSISPDPVPGDLTGDDRADLGDLLLYLEWFGKKQPWADLTDDGTTDTGDLRRYLEHWSSAR